MSPRAACRLQVLGYERVYDYVDGIADWKAAGLPTEGSAETVLRVSDAIRTDIPTCGPEERVAMIRSRVAETGWDMCVVLDCDGIAVGRIRGSGLDANIGERASEVMEPGPSTVRPDMLLSPLVDRMKVRNAPNVIVTTPQGNLLGVLVRDDAARLMAGDSPEQIWRDCDSCPGRWSETAAFNEQRPGGQ